MSDNIINVKTVSGMLTIDEEDLDKFIDENNEDFPEDCFLYEQNDTIITDLTWVGTLSGRSFSVLKNNFLPLTKGQMEVILIWEDGEMEKLVINDGNVEVVVI